MGGSLPANGCRSTAHSKYVSTVTSRPSSPACPGTIRSTAVFAKTARAASVSHSSGDARSRMCSTSTFVALIAFSQAITASGAAPSARARSPSTMTGATNFRMVGPTAVVTISAREISAATSCSLVPLLIAR